MHRRRFITLAAAFAALPGAARAFATDYTPGVAEALMAEGRIVLLDFHATWCPTCAAQERVLQALTTENPAYGQAIAFVKVDWDSHGRGPLAQKLRIPRRSTLVLLKGEEELGRIVAGTARSQIEALLDQGLAAAE